MSTLRSRLDTLFYSAFTLAPVAVILGLVDFRFHQYYWPFLNVARALGRKNPFDFLSFLDWYVLLVVGFFILRAIFIKETRPKLKMEPIWVPVLLICMGLVISRLFWNPTEPILKSYWIQIITNFVNPILLFLVILLSNPKQEWLEKLQRVFMISFSALGLVCITEFFTNIFPGVNKDFLGRLVWPYIDPFVDMKAESANWLAFLFAPVAILAFIHLVQKKNRILALTTFVITFIVLLITKSYTGIGITAAILAYILFIHLPKNQKKYVAVGFLVLLAIGVSTQYNSRKFQILLGDYKKANSIERRVQIYTFTAKAFREHPFVGVGPGNYQSYFRKNMESFGTVIPEEEIPPHPHNFIAFFWSELGLSGALAALFLYIFILKAVFVSPRAHMVFFPATYFLGHGILDVAHGLPEISVMFWLILAIAILDSQARKGVAHL